ncbi:hypothetical protein QYE76_045588 [Lolium multiflorum]|uniref:F-box domain-containing protein n=1 Tax=Lolium multiflorum TaxID=4521 RepID=A0AAD8TKN2_LOLMU|nr:hypothetical protein QYE76_045588 [Lolium multiflorum]
MEKARISEDSADPSTNCDWSQLQADLLVQIFGSLDIPDLFSSGAVCRSWHLNYMEARRLRLCSPNQSPCLVYSSGDRDANTATLHNMSTNKLYHVTLADPAFRTRYVMGSSFGWLITADERSNLIFVNPVTRAEIAMPPPETMHNVRLRYSEEGVLDGYDVLSVDLISRDFDIETETYDVTLEEGRFHFYMRVVLSCDPSSANCIVLRVHLPDNHLSYARNKNQKHTREYRSMYRCVNLNMALDGRVHGQWSEQIARRRSRQRDRDIQDTALAAAIAQAPNCNPLVQRHGEHLRADGVQINTLLPSPRLPSMRVLGRHTPSPGIPDRLSREDGGVWVELKGKARSGATCGCGGTA